jgi:hypothetical protein
LRARYGVICPASGVILYVERMDELWIEGSF